MGGTNVRRRGMGSPEPPQDVAARYQHVRPPLTAIVCPVTKAASTLAR